MPGIVDEGDIGLGRLFDEVRDLLAQLVGIAVEDAGDVEPEVIHQGVERPCVALGIIEAGQHLVIALADHERHAAQRLVRERRRRQRRRNQQCGNQR